MRKRTDRSSLRFQHLVHGQKRKDHQLEQRKREICPFGFLGKLEQRKHCHTRFFSTRTKGIEKNKFVIISLSLDLDKKEWMEKIIQRDTTQWKQVCDFKGWDNSIVKQQGITRIPANILIGPDKRVITQDIRGKELIDKVKQLIEQDKEKEKAAKEAERTRKRQNKK